MQIAAILASPVKRSSLADVQAEPWPSRPLAVLTWLSISANLNICPKLQACTNPKRLTLQLDPRTSKIKRSLKTCLTATHHQLHAVLVSRDHVVRTTTGCGRDERRCSKGGAGGKTNEDIEAAELIFHLGSSFPGDGVFHFAAAIIGSACRGTEAENNTASPSGRYLTSSS